MALEEKTQADMLDGNIDGSLLNTKKIQTLPYARTQKKKNRYFTAAIIAGASLASVFGALCTGRQIFKNSTSRISFSNSMEAYPYCPISTPEAKDVGLEYYCRSDRGAIVSAYIIDSEGNKIMLEDNINDTSHIGTLPPHLKNGTYRFGIKLQNGREWTSDKYTIDVLTRSFSQIFGE